MGKAQDWEGAVRCKSDYSFRIFTACHLNSACVCVCVCVCVFSEALISITLFTLVFVVAVCYYFHEVSLGVSAASVKGQKPTF